MFASEDDESIKYYHILAEAARPDQAFLEKILRQRPKKS
jgi:hypothetical protein